MVQRLRQRDKQKGTLDAKNGMQELEARRVETNRRGEKQGTCTRKEREEETKARDFVLEKMDEEGKKRRAGRRMKGKRRGRGGKAREGARLGVLALAILS